MPVKYNLSAEDSEEINILINDFYYNIENEFEKLSFLDIVTDMTCKREEFYDQFLQVHQEVRETNHKIRHFILMKVNKIKKENTHTVPLMDIIGAFSNETEKKYWELVQHLYILLEASCDDSQDDVISTITVELQKRHDKEQEMFLEKQAKEQQQLLILEEKQKSRDERAKKQQIPDVDEMLSHLDNNPEVMEIFNKMSGGASTKNMNQALKQAMKENPEMTNMFKSAISMMGDSEDANNDMMSVLEQFMPKVDMECHTNIVLLNKIYNDIIYVFSTNDDNNTNIKDRIITKTKMYRSIIEKGKLTPDEIVACIWKITTHDEMKDYIVNMSKTEITMELVLSIATEVLPKDWIDNFGDIEKIKSMCSGMSGGGIDIVSMMDMFKSANPGVSEPEIILTEEQMLELEKYYDENK